jgi:redox-sensitive bicupin YhaK (pirin superfamily)
MREILRKDQQVQATMFGGRFHSNKPVVGGRGPSGAPSAALFYWSHAYATGDCEFGLHPHEGFEIMTFVLDGENAHYDTETRRWIPLRKGDFQVIRSGAGLAHAERIAKGTRAFQMWFDPDVSRAIAQAPEYEDHLAADIATVAEDGVTITEYVGGQRGFRPATPGLLIQKLAFTKREERDLPLEAGKRYSIYVVAGRARLDGALLETDDVMNAADGVLRVAPEPGCELFVVALPASPAYTPMVQPAPPRRAQPVPA